MPRAFQGTDGLSLQTSQTSIGWQPPALSATATVSKRLRQVLGTSPSQICHSCCGIVPVHERSDEQQPRRAPTFPARQKAQWTQKKAPARTPWFVAYSDEMLDSFDEELEMEIDDERLAKLLTEVAEQPEQQTIDRQRYFHGAVPPAGRAREAPGLGGQREAQGGRVLRGPRCRRQGRRDQAHHAAPESARLPRGRAAGARPSASAPSGISSATSRTCRRAARSCCSTAAGTTAPASSG